MNDFDFSCPSRQSAKGILVIFVFNTYKFIKKSITLLLLFAFSFFRKGTFFGFSTSYLIIILMAIGLFLLIKAFLSYLNFTFHISGNDFHLSTGILKKENITIPKSKIQNVYIKQNVLQQIINVVQVNVETAGDNSTEIEISAVKREKAMALKQELFCAKESDAEDKRQVDVFYQASLKKLLLEGASQNHIKSFFIILAFIGGLYANFKDFVERFSWQSYFGDWLNMNDHTFFKAILFNSAIIVVLIIVTFLLSLVKTMLLNYNLQVVDNNKTIEITKGLFNKVSLSLTPSRIQNIQIRTNRVKRYFGLYTMAFKQAMVAKKQQKHFYIIGLGKEEVDYLSQRLYTGFDNGLKKHRPENYYKRILLLKSIPLLVVGNGIAYQMFENWFWAVNLMVIPYLFLVFHWRFKKAFYTMDDRYLSIGSGSFIGTNLEMLEIHKIQSIDIEQSIFQKRKNIASLKICTASKVVTIPYIKHKKAQAIMDYLLFKVESQRLDWM